MKFFPLICCAVVVVLCGVVMAATTGMNQITVYIDITACAYGARGNITGNPLLDVKNLVQIVKTFGWGGCGSYYNSVVTTISTMPFVTSLGLLQPTVTPFCQSFVTTLVNAMTPLTSTALQALNPLNIQDCINACKAATNAVGAVAVNIPK